MVNVIFFVQAIDCGKLHVPRNGTMVGNKTTYPNTLKFGCDEGFILIGSSMRECQTNGSWSGNKTKCQGVMALTCFLQTIILIAYLQQRELKKRWCYLMQHKIVVPWQPQKMGLLLVNWQSSQTRSYLAVMKDFFAAVLVSGIVRQTEHGVEIRQFAKVVIYYLLTESEVITGKSQTEALMYWPSDSEVNTSRPRSEISL